LAQIITIKRTLRALRARGSGTVADVIQKKQDVPAAKSSQEGSSSIEVSIAAAAAASANEIPTPMELTKESIDEGSI
jgi:hypothetical protein